MPTVPELKKELDDLGISYPNDILKGELEKLLELSDPVIDESLVVKDEITEETIVDEDEEDLDAEWEAALSALHNAVSPVKDTPEEEHTKNTAELAKRDAQNDEWENDIPEEPEVKGWDTPTLPKTGTCAACLLSENEGNYCTHRNAAVLPTGSCMYIKEEQETEFVDPNWGDK